MSEQEKQYSVIRWTQGMSSRGWPRFEVRPTEGLEVDNRYTVVAGSLSFSEAYQMRNRLESEEVLK